MKYFALVFGVFYSVLCIFSIVTGIMYFLNKRKLNPVELSNEFYKKLEEKGKINSFSRNMGIVTFLVGLFQGACAYGLFTYSLYYLVFGFTLFSFLSVFLKIIGKFSKFAFLKMCAYVIMIVMMIMNGFKVLF